MRIRSTLIVLALAICTANAQSYQSQRDSLLQLLENTKDPIKQVDLLNEISYNYRRVSPQKVIEYGQQALQLAVQHSYKKGEGIANKNIGTGYFKLKSPLDSIIYHYEKCLEISASINDNYNQAACNNNLALAYQLVNKDYLALQYYLKGIDIFDKQVELGQDRLKALMLGNVGLTYIKIGEPQKGKTYLDRSIQLAREKDIPSILAQYLSPYGKLIYKLGNGDDAISLIKESVLYQNKLGDTQSFAQSHIHLSEIYQNQGNLEKAELAAQTALQTAESENFVLIKAISLRLLSGIAMERGQIDKGIQFSEQALDIYDKAGISTSLPELLLHLSELYEKNQQPGKALTLARQSFILTDSIKDVAIASASAQAEVKYQIKEKEREIDSLNQQQEIQKITLRLYTVCIILALLLMLTAGYLLYKRSQLLKTIHEKNVAIEVKNSKLEHYIASNLQLENFAYFASHDLKTPLRNIVSFTQLLFRKTNTKLLPEELEYLQFIIDSGKELSFLIDDLLDYSRIQKQEIALEKFSVSELVNGTLQKLKYTINEKQALIKTDIQVASITADHLKIRQLFQNLLTNAIKFQPPNQQAVINIRAYSDNQFWHFEVEDNGIGIKPNYHDKVFLIFKRLHNKDEYEGSGIGLAICKEIIEQHHGEIGLRSNEGPGCTFFFSIPKNIRQLVVEEAKKSKIQKSTHPTSLLQEHAG